MGEDGEPSPLIVNPVPPSMWWDINQMMVVVWLLAMCDQWQTIHDWSHNYYHLHNAILVQNNLYVYIYQLVRNVWISQREITKLHFDNLRCVDIVKTLTQQQLNSTST